MAVGLHDMLGNVWEWTSSVYKPTAQLRDRNKPKYTTKGGSFMDQNITISARSQQLNQLFLSLCIFLFISLFVSIAFAFMFLVYGYSSLLQTYP